MKNKLKQLEIWNYFEMDMLCGPGYQFRDDDQGTTDPATNLPLKKQVPEGPPEAFYTIKLKKNEKKIIFTKNGL